MAELLVFAWLVGLWYSVAFHREKTPPVVKPITRWGTEALFRPILFPEFYRGKYGPYNKYGYQTIPGKPIGYDLDEVEGS